ncbi:MAG TPA: hypothetical protein DHU56_04215 [Marinobacter sp.]|nr:hypothetical protein [Marinobacter sp.]
MKGYGVALVLLGLSLSGCSDTEGLANATAEQARLVQDQIHTFADACIGKLSVTVEVTGKRENPTVWTMQCSEMNKEHSIFGQMSEEDVEQIKVNVRTLHQ